MIKKNKQSVATCSNDSQRLERNTDLTVSKKRELWLDALKGFLILTVIFIHNVFDVSSQTSHLIVKWITSYHMFLFFTISGFCFSFWKYSFKTLFKKRLKSLMIPYLVWGIVIGEIVENLVSVVQSGFNIDVNFVLDELIGFITFGKSYLATWFLYVLFVVVFLEYLIEKLCKDIKEKCHSNIYIYIYI